MSEKMEILDFKIPDGGAIDLNPQLSKTGVGDGEGFVTAV